MHKSKLAGFIIDCQTDDLGRAADFWAGALGMPVRELPADEAALYKGLQDSQHGLNIEVQKVNHPSRVHLDIETDDIDAEVLRLEKLGAKRIQAIRTCGSWRRLPGNDFAWCGRPRRHLRRKPHDGARRPADGPRAPPSGVTTRRRGCRGHGLQSCDLNVVCLSQICDIFDIVQH